MTGIAPSTAYNLAVPTIFALTAVGAWGVALALQGSFRTIYAGAWRWWLQALPANERRKLAGALLAALFTVVAGNWSNAIWMLPGTGSNPPESCDKGTSYAAQQICGGREEWAFWDATRVVSIKTGDGVINEFPFFTFLFADLHAHMIGLPLLVAALGVMLALVRRRTRVRQLWPRWRQRLVPVLLLGLISGVSYATNTWDYPTIVGMAIVTLLLVAWRDEQRRPNLLNHLIGLGVAVAVLMISSRIVNWPFSQWFASDYTGFEVWTGPRTPTALLIELSGMWMYAAISAGTLLLIRLRWLTVPYALGSAAVVIAALALGILQAVPALYVEVGAIVLMIGLIVAVMTRSGVIALPSVWLGQSRVIQLELPVFAEIERRAEPRLPSISLETIFTIVMVLAMFGISALTEVLVAKGDIGRMNSVFKFGMQVWVFGAISSAVMLVWVWQFLRKYLATVQLSWQVVTAVLVAATFVYPATATPARLGDRYDRTIPMTLDGEAYMSSPNSTWGENGTNFDFSEDVAGINWIRDNVQGVPILLEAHAEAYRWDARIANYTGLPTLIGWPWHETQQRSVTDVGSVLGARQAAVQRWYSDTDAAKTFAEIQTYGVEYVYVGRMEKALYGAQSGVAFAQLASEGKITEVFRVGETVIYQVPVADHAPGVLKTGTLARFAPEPLAQQSLLTVETAQLPEVTSPGWNPLQNTVVIVVLCLLAWYLIALLGLLPALWLGDAQWVWARVIGLLVLGYALWLPVSARLMYNSTTGLVVAVILVLKLSLWALFRIGMRQKSNDAMVAEWFDWNDVIPALQRGFRHVLTTLRAQIRTIAVFEAIFTGSFLLLVVIRMVNPDLWHSTWGGEKPFEFGLLNAVLRSPVMPPYSPFFSGGTVNYYYYGYVLLSLPIRLIGVAPAVGYNLVLASLYALLMSGVAALLWQVARQRWATVVAVLALGVIGNPASALEIGWSRGLKQVFEVYQSQGLAGMNSALGDWFVGSTRVIPNTINEYPAWSFVFGDLHAHVIALPFAVFLLALAWQALTHKRLAGAWWIFAPMVVGTLAITNSWDAPTAVLILCGALVRRAWTSSRPWLAVWAVVQVALIAAVAYVGYLPFFQQYVPQIGGIAQVTTQSPWAPWLAMWGLFVVPAIVAAVVIAWQNRWMQIVVASVLVLLAVVGLTVPLWGAWATPIAAWLGDPRIWLVGFMLLVLPFLLKRQSDHQLWFGMWMIFVAWAVALGVEVIYIRDHMGDGDWYRMNTVFKFGVQSWLLLSVGIATLLPVLWERLRQMHRAVLPVVAAAMIVPVVMGASFTIIGIPNRMAYRMNADQAPTLDGLAFMKTGTYNTVDRDIPFVSDYNAIQWLNSNVKGLPVIMQSSIEFYRGYGVRIAANTGFPTVVSPLHESEQRNGDVVGKRDADVIDFYRSTDIAQKSRLLSRYRVGYVIVGPIERAAYGKEGTDAIASIGSLREVYKSGETSIYQVSPNIVQVPPQGSVNGDDTTPAVSFPSEPPPPPEDLSELEQKFAADPSNVDVMIALVDGYRRQQRYEEATTIVAQNQTTHPGDVMILHMLGDTAMEARLYDQAIQAYRDAVTASDNGGNANKLINGLINANRIDDALTESTAAIAKYTDFFDLYITRARIEEMIGDYEAAKADYQAYLDKAPADSGLRSEAQDGLNRLSK
jgi:YYY domain-containing protein